MTKPTTVYCVFSGQMQMPFYVTSLLEIYQTREAADAKVAQLSAENEDPMESDSYGLLNGRDFFVNEIKVLEETTLTTYDHL